MHQKEIHHSAFTLSPDQKGIETPMVAGADAMSFTLSPDQKGIETAYA